MGIANHHRVKPAEAGIAEMMKNIFTNYDSPLTEKTLCNWHEMLMSGRRNIEIGKYRAHKEAMQVVSGRYDKPKVHFEAPPSADVPKEMEKFIDWFNKSAPSGKEPLTPLVRAGIAHIYFVSMHPFEDGNGRIGRGIVEKSLSQNLVQPTLIALSSTIDDKKRESQPSPIKSDQPDTTGRAERLSRWIQCQKLPSNNKISLSNSDKRFTRSGRQRDLYKNRSAKKHPLYSGYFPLPVPISIVTPIIYWVNVVLLSLG